MVMVNVTLKVGHRHMGIDCFNRHNIYLLVVHRKLKVDLTIL
jgi:hypothetical protein